MDFEKSPINAHDPTDMTLVKRVMRRDESALILLYRRYGTLVYSIAYRSLGNEQDAEEVTQDVFLTIWDKARQYKAQRGVFAAWLTTITRNAAIDRLRKRERRDPQASALSLDEAPELWETLKVDDNHQDLQRDMAEAFHQLSLEQQEALHLAYFHGMAQREIASALKRPLGTIKSHMRQGIERLRQIWLIQES